MMKSTLIALALLSAFLVSALTSINFSPWGTSIAQPTKAPPAPEPATPNFCDVTYALAGEQTADQKDAGGNVAKAPAIPWVDVVDNHAKALKILDALSKEGEKGGPYTVTVTETRTCDGGNTVRVADSSAEVQGVTAEGLVKVTDVSIDQAKQINDRYRQRVKAGAKTLWNHKNAKNVKRNDLGQRVDN